VHTIPIVLRQYRYCEIASRSFVNGLPCYSQPHVSFFSWSSLASRPAQVPSDSDATDVVAVSQKRFEDDGALPSRLFGDKTLAVWQCSRLLHLCAVLDTVWDLRTMSATVCKSTLYTRLAALSIHTPYEVEIIRQRRTQSYHPCSSTIQYTTSLPVYTDLHS
jgi:hypothetical protein